MKKTKVGIIGCGNIAPAYVKGCRLFANLDLVACADILPSTAEALAQAYGLKAMSIEAMLADSEIEIVINLTIPAVHVPPMKPCTSINLTVAPLRAAAMAAAMPAGPAPQTITSQPSTTGISFAGS